MARMTWANYHKLDAERDAKDEAWRRENWERNQATQLQLAAVEIERLRRIARTQKSEYDGLVEHLTQRIVMLTKSIEVAEERLSNVSKRERARHAREAETVKRIGAVETATLLVADAITKQAVTKAAPTIKRKTVHRDANNRITSVTEEEVAI